MKVFIDSREQEKVQKVLTYFETNKKKFPHIESIEVKTLDTSDLATADGNIGIERKSSKDFVASFCSDRLKQQLFELRSNYKTPLLIVEDYDGIMDCIVKNPQLHPNVVLGVVSSALSHNGVPITFVGPFYIPFVLQLIEKTYDGSRETYENIEYTPIRRSWTKDNMKLNIVVGIPQVNEILGLRLLQTFGSIKAIANATEEELQQVPGIGEEKAKQIKEVLE
jgi:ERCC4-type nuclease